MKKILVFILSALLCVSLIGCGTKDSNTQSINIYAPDGAPALALAKLIAEDMQFDKNVNYTIVSASEIGSTVVQKTGDMVIIPVNAASKIATDGTDYKMVSVNTHGNLYIIGNQAKASLSDLKGEVLGVIGQGLVPDLTLRYILQRDNIDYQIGDTKADGKITLRYFADASEMIPALRTNVISFGLLPEPAMTKALSVVTNAAMLFDLQELWGATSYPQAVLLAKTSLIESDPEFINAFLQAMDDNVEWLPLNIETAVTAINSHLKEGIVGSLSASLITSDVITNCNIKVIKATEAKTSVINYLTAIKSVSDISAKIVTDNFFANI